MEASTLETVGLSAALSFMTGLYFVQRKENAIKAAVISTRLMEMETKLALVNAAVVPISTAFQAILVKELTHFHTPEMDALMVKIGPPSTLSESDEARLGVMLRERMEDMGAEISDSERGAAMILPEVMKRARAEQEILASGPAPQVKLVAVIETEHDKSG